MAKKTKELPEKGRNINGITPEGIDGNPRTRKTPKGYRENNKIDKGIRVLATQHPEWSLHRIGLELKGMGVIKDERSVYKRTKKNPYVTAELAEIRRKNFETMSREIVPEALKIHKKALKSKELTLKEKHPWVVAAERAEFHYDQTKAPGAKETVNIGQLQVYQQIVQANLDHDGPGPLRIDGTIEPEFTEIQEGQETE